jgi:phosphoribosylglycinamide formyltransferase-1
MSPKFPIAILVSGSGTNLQAIIDAIEAGHLDAEIKIVISNNPNAPALNRAKKHGIRCAVHAVEDAVANEIEACGAELICLAGFMRILSPKFIKKFSGKIINIHPALLPDFPGLHAQRQALAAGARESGCTVHFVNEGVDTGPVIMQARVKVLPGDTEETLSARILKEEHKLYPAVIQLFAKRRIRLDGQRVLIEPEK